MQLINGYGIDLSTQPAVELSPEVGRTVHELVCRQDFNSPGFALIDLGATCNSKTLRARMLELKDGISHYQYQQTGQSIVAVWLGRFNQQVSTKFHLDGGPDASLLMLGYEPSRVVSQVRLADYSHAAARHEMSPREFLDSHNPMFPGGEEFLRPDIVEISLANHQHFQILLVNNSCQTLSDRPPGWQGVLHQAIMIVPLPGEDRIVNSMLLTVGNAASDPLTDTVRQDYLNTDQVNQRM